jgi:hypothetical protein
VPQRSFAALAALFRDVLSTHQRPLNDSKFALIQIEQIRRVRVGHFSDRYSLQRSGSALRPTPLPSNTRKFSRAVVTNHVPGNKRTLC